MSFSFGTKKEKSQSTSTTDPWKASVPYVTDFLGALPKFNPAASGAMSSAAGNLASTYGAGNPYAGRIDTLTKELFSTKSMSPMVGSAYKDFQTRMTPTANGQNLDLDQNPYLQDMMQKNADSVSQRINAQFAGAGRDLSGMNQLAVAKGVTDAQLPVMFDQYNREQGRTDAAARDLWGAANPAATTMQSLDQNAMGQRLQGIDAAGSAIDAKTWGPENIMALEKTLKDLPLDQASKLADILFGAAGLGQQSSGNSVGKSSSMGMSFKVGDIIKALAAAGGG